MVLSHAAPQNMASVHIFFHHFQSVLKTSSATSLIDQISLSLFLGKITQCLSHTTAIALIISNASLANPTEMKSHWTWNNFVLSRNFESTQLHCSQMQAPEDSKAAISTVGQETPARSRSVGHRPASTHRGTYSTCRLLQGT